jgi:hypothetical protein
MKKEGVRMGARNPATLMVFVSQRLSDWSRAGLVKERDNAV